MIRPPKAWSVFAYLSLLVFAASMTWGQTGTTSVRGVVLDKSGAAVVGAQIKLANTAQALQRETRSNSSGEYEFLALPPGTYTLTAEKEGFSKYEEKGLHLLVNAPSTVMVKLEVGSVTSQIEVSAAGESINTTDASLGNAFDENQVKQLPLESRNVPDLLSLQTGVLYTGNSPAITSARDIDTRNGAVNGARSDQSNVTVDGIPANDQGSHSFTSVIPVTLDSMQEFRVTTTNYGADEGSSSAAQVALVTKSGTNNFHGSVYEYNRNSFVSANDYFIKSSQLASGDPNVPNFLNRNIFGASLGGPIIKNRLFLFLNFEGYRDAEDISAVRTVPTAAMRDGVIQYLCLVGTPCTGNTVQGISGASYTAPAGDMAVAPATITNWDSTSLAPQPGPDAAVLQYMSQYPLPNDQTTGDLLNTAGFRFRDPTKTHRNWYVAKLDYNITSDGKHRLSLTGALANESSDYGTSSAPFLPNTPPQVNQITFNKGLIAGYTAVLSPTLINNFRYGFVRQSLGMIGNSNQPWNYLQAFSQGISYSSAFQRPINNFTDDVSWNRSKHTWQFGFQFAFLRNPESNLNNSFNVGQANPDWLADSGLSGSSNPSPLNPANNGYALVDPSFQSNYDYAMTSLLGMITFGDAIYNYNRSGNPLAEGAPVVRRFAEDSYEMYAQDTWKVKPNLTVTLGLRYSLFSPPWETNGLQVGTTFSLGTWFNERGTGMEQGIPSNAAPLITYNWAGPANGKPGYYNWDTHNFGPRIAFAWSPDYSDGWLGKVFGGPSKSSIRGGFGIVYDRVGESLVNTFDQNGSFGLASTLNNPSDFETSQIAPRLTSMNVIPAADYQGNPILPPAPTNGSGLGQPYPVGSGAIQWGIDQSLKTPYSYTVDFAVSRELPSGFSLDVAYVGRYSHRLLAQDDLAMPLDIHDKQSGIDYFTAEKALAKVFRPELNAGVTNPTNSFNPNQVPTNVQQFWQNQIQPLATGYQYPLTGCTGGNTAYTTSPVVFAFDTFCATGTNDSLALYNLDYNGVPDPNSNQVYFSSGGQYSYYAPQFSSLYAWRSMAWSNYNALQATLRHRLSHGLQFDLNYTFSKSLDISSDAERVGPASNGSLLGLNNNIINAWNPNAQKGVSSFDATHQLNANWIWELPIGRGQRFAHGSGRALDAAIGGWQLSGVFRVTSGFPVTVDNGFSSFPTNFEMEGNADKIAPVKTGAYLINGVPNIFANGPAAISSFAPAYAGESGERNNIRGAGYFGIDLGLSKRWMMPWTEKQSLQLRWEVFNVTNSASFDVQSSLLSNSLGLGSGGSFGNYSGLLNNPRIMEFALRYEF
ncbi:MAG: TonB-dependent receptor [Terriglobales bacterium]